MPELVSINGKVTEPKDAKISVFDRGFMFGDSIYEVARSYDGLFFGLNEHLDRLFNSARLLSIGFTTPREALIRDIYELFDKSKLPDAYMRIIVTRGESIPNINPAVTSTPPNVVIMMRPLAPIDPRNYQVGLNLVTSKFLRNSKKALDPNAKSGNYLNNILAMGQAVSSQADDAIMTNQDGFITEGTTWNLLMVKNGEVISPPDSADMLLGITRKFIRDICKREKIPWVERFFTVEECLRADEVLMTASIKEVMNVHSIDGKVIGELGPMGKRLRELYLQDVKNFQKTYKRP